MKTFKKLTKTLLLLSALALTLVLIVSCNSSKTPEETTADLNQNCEHTTTEWIVDKNATCSAEGSRHKECVSCKQNLETATIATTAHTEELVAGKAASCTEEGLTTGKKCSVCQAVVL